MKINKILPQKHKYLQIITNIAHKPEILYYKGSLPDEALPTVAIIGSRRPTQYGKEVCQKIVGDLVQQGVVIMSGLALGIDAIAHRTALMAGGTTIAILPCGLDQIYPASHRQLGQAIVQQGGALISEYSGPTPAYPAHFIARNRIVSGLAMGTVIIEAAAKSGTLHTARFALDQGKSVMAVPGNITNPLSEGCNNLIKMGARLITTAAEICNEIGLTPSRQAILPLGQTPDEQTLITFIAKGIHDGLELQTRSSLDAVAFSRALTMLEIQGIIRPTGGNRWILT